MPRQKRVRPPSAAAAPAPVEAAVAAPVVTPPLAATPSPEPPDAAPRALPLGRRLAFLSVPFVLFFLVLGGIEWWVRAHRPHISLLEALVRNPEQSAGFTDRRKVSVFEGDPLLFWRVKPKLSAEIWDYTLISTNAQGLRYPAPVGAKPKGTFRIGCFGDSVTFGYRIPVVWAERPNDYGKEDIPYPLLMEKSLRAANAGRAIEVLPLASPGYSSHQGRAWVGRDLGRLQPDVITLCFGWNDINLRPRTDRETMSVGRHQVVLRTLMGKSQALTHASLWMNARRTAQEPPRTGAETTRVPAAEYAENMWAMVRTARDHGVKVLVIAPVYRDGVTDDAKPESLRLAPLREALRELVKREKIPYLEIPDLMEGAYPGNDRLFGEKIHPNAVGHRLMADKVMAALSSQGMLDGLTLPPPMSY